MPASDENINVLAKLKFNSAKNYLNFQNCNLNFKKLAKVFRNKNVSQTDVVKVLTFTSNVHCNQDFSLKTETVSGADERLRGDSLIQ